MAAEYIKNKILQTCNLTFSLDDIGILRNQDIIELCNKIAKTPCTYEEVAEFLKCDPAFLRRKVSNLKKKISSLRGEKKEQLLSEIFLKPLPSTSSTPSSKTKSGEFEDTSQQAKVISLNETILALPFEKKERLSALQSENVSLKESKRKLKRQVTSTSDLIKKKRAKCSELASQVYLLSRRKSYRETHKKRKTRCKYNGEKHNKITENSKKNG